MLEFKSLSFDYECKQTEINGVAIGIIRGHAAAFSKDLVDDIIEPGAFAVTLKTHRDRGRPIRMKFQHKRDEIIGGFPSDKAFEDGKGLFVEGHINLQVQKGIEAFALAKQGVLTDMSIGFGLPRFEIDTERDVRILKEIDLSEISIVDDPANQDATIIDVKMDIKEIQNMKDLNRFLKNLGVTNKERNILVSKVKEFGSRDADNLDPGRDAEAMSEFAKGLENLIAILKGA